MVGLSWVQPEPWAILAAGRRIVPVPSGLPVPRYRGEVLLHANVTCDPDAFDQANRWLLERGLLPPGVHLPWSADLPRGGFVGRAMVVQMLHIDSGTGCAFASDRDAPCAFCHPGDVACCERNQWLDPERATRVLLLADVAPLPAFVPAPAPSMPGLEFRVDGDVFLKALALATAARTEVEQDAVAEVWRVAPRRRRSSPCPVARGAEVGV